jgi:hypothetical protein
VRDNSIKAGVAIVVSDIVTSIYDISAQKAFQDAINLHVGFAVAYERLQTKLLLTERMKIPTIVLFNMQNVPEYTTPHFVVWHWRSGLVAN